VIKRNFLFDYKVTSIDILMKQTIG